jgi:DNA-binding GntR family transcriptional regulator
LQALSYVVADLYWSATDALPPGRLVRHDHHEIAEAILAGDAERARLRMQAHARATSEGILARVGQPAHEPFVWTRRRLGTAAYRQRPPAGVLA